MKIANRSYKALLKDVQRLASTGDVLSRAGTLLIRKSPRAASWTAVMTTSGFLSKQVTGLGFDALEALVVPLIVGIGMLSLGLALKYIPSTIWRQLTTLAVANDLNLMEDYRKTQLNDHLNCLWDEVFWHEANLRYTPEQMQDERERIAAVEQIIRKKIRNWDKATRAHLGIKDVTDLDDVVLAVLAERPISENLERSREGFFISSLYALRHALPQSTQKAKIGFGLALYEDFCDGAYFDQSDEKLFQQYVGHTTIISIKNECQISKLAILGQIPRKVSRKLWFSLVTRKVAMGVGKAVRSLNRQYNTDMFNTQVLLWPGEEDAAWVGDFPDARDKVLELRKQIVFSALGKTYENAVAVLDRVQLPCFEFALDLRVRYDYEYLDNSLDHKAQDTGDTVMDNVMGDLDLYGYCEKDKLRMQQKIESARQDMALFLDFLDTSPYRESAENRLILRAIKTAFHSNRNGIRKMFQNKRKPIDPQRVNATIEAAINEHQAYSQKLISLRMHFQLTQMKISGYRSIAKKLAYESQ